MSSTHPERPRIGVTWVKPGSETSDNYLRAVSAAGGEPIPLLENADSWSAELDSLHGLMLTGGGDVDPDLYGAENEASTLVNRERDEMELEAVRQCLDRALPVLGICRGFQLLNVFHGGPLVQDIRTAIQHRSNRDHSSTHHTIEILPGTALAAIVGTLGPLRVNSRHHQGVLQLAPGLKTTALAPDGLVEGFEREDGRFLVGVQCHPERPGEAPEMVRVIEALVDRARTA